MSNKAVIFHSIPRGIRIFGDIHSNFLNVSFLFSVYKLKGFLYVSNVIVIENAWKNNISRIFKRLPKKKKVLNSAGMILFYVCMYTDYEINISSDNKTKSLT